MSSQWGVSVYASGELTAKFMHENSIIQGRQKGQKAQPYGVSRKGRNNIRRAANGYLSTTRDALPIFITLTTHHKMSDRKFKYYVSKLIKRGLKLDPMFRCYILSFELHASGQMHCHILMFEWMDCFDVMQEIWAKEYDMGVYSFDIRKVGETATAAAGYLAKLPRYMAKDNENTPRPINGRTHTISQALQPFTKPLSLPISVPGESQALSKLSDYATLLDDYYMRLFTPSAAEAVDLLRWCGIPVSLKPL